MANINNPILDTLATDGAVVFKNEYRGNAQVIPFFIDNGTSLINSGDTITFTATLPPDAVGGKVHLKTAGVGAGSTLQFSAGGTNITAAIDIGTGAVDATYLFTVAGAATVDLGGLVIIGTVAAADWDDGANDLWGQIEIVTNQ
jgi:hypothetical protein